ncbi:hypothetical protein KI387_028758 [Taxus chinensis]|uniref:Fungal lipase-type domain-containing protein n=1 Tax=Taxus chinensis TaxID=29808 RepID=A0AA38CDM3_TAXCH|nr:hypothetical protein KI387_028758 [Taxus chinensis]
MAEFPLPSVDRNDSSDNTYKTMSSLPTSSQISGCKDGSQAELCDVWRDIQGANNWNGLLDPINPILKSEALRYGHFARLCYDAFDGDGYGTCKHSKRELFDKMGVSNTVCIGYQVTKYIYANTDVLRSFFGDKSQDIKGVWLGFVAVSVDTNQLRRLGRRDIVIVWRGTQTTQEWIQDLKDFLVPARLSYKCERTCKDRQPANEGVRIERGFLTCYTSTIHHHEDSVGKFANVSARDLVIAEISRLLKVYENEIDDLSITFTGHSLGAALATLSAYDIKQMLNSKYCSRIPVTVFSFASPRVGNLAFAKQVEQIGVKVLRLVNEADVVPKVPRCFVE